MVTLDTQNDDDGIVINGELHSVEDLTFREQRELRTLVRQLADDPEAEMDQMAMMDIVPAFVYVVMKRDDPTLNMDDVLDMRLTDFMPDTTENGNGNGNGNGHKPGPPTKAKAKASGTSGRRRSQPSTA